MTLIGTPNITCGGGLDIIHTLRFLSTEWTSFEWKKKKSTTDGTTQYLISYWPKPTIQGQSKYHYFYPIRFWTYTNWPGPYHLCTYCPLIVLHCYNINMMDLLQSSKLPFLPHPCAKLYQLRVRIMFFS